ncbi:MAG TPA: DsbA family protein [Gammaproteobacteria bacterium]|jgi:protein-disulfide isomerase|nr:DsbA family protein [Gammaproteobacteria bacterium]
MSRFMKKLALTAAIASMATASYAAFSDAQQKEIQTLINNYLQNNPQVIISALQGYQQKQMQQAEQTIKNTQKDASKYAKDLFHANNDPVGGNPKGTITIAEFFDYQCPHCVDMSPILNNAIKDNPNLRVVFKEFPIRGPMSEFAARAALAANMQGKYMQLHDALMQIKPPFTQESILAAAKSVGLSIDKLQTDMKSDAITQQINANMKLGQDLKLLGTPAIFVGKTDATTASNINYAPGFVDQNQLNDLIKKNS